MILIINYVFKQEKIIINLLNIKIINISFKYFFFQQKKILRILKNILIKKN